MDIRETISVAIDALRANKLRAILTSLGVISEALPSFWVVTVAADQQEIRAFPDREYRVQPGVGGTGPEAGQTAAAKL